VVYPAKAGGFSPLKNLIKCPTFENIIFQMTIKLSEAQKKAPINNSDSIAATMQQILKRENKLGRSQEHFWVVGLNNANKILFIELIGLGRQNRVTANPPDVFRMGIYKLALKLILVHNHPSGELLPSTADRSFTDRIIKVGEIINIDVIDHLIISEKDHLSFADLGIIDQLKASDTWRLVEKEELEVRKMKEEVERKEIKKQNTLNIASKMKLKGIDDTLIKEITGLSISIIKKI
jgi:DNA repair protein RadC